MGKQKESKTNAMRILDKNKVSYEVHTYECEEFIDGVHIADQLHQPYEMSFKTIVTVGKSKEYYVFARPVDKELDLKKAAKAVKEKSLELLHVKDINAVNRYIRDGWITNGMKKQYQTVIHESANKLTKMIVSGGKLGVQIELCPDDLIRVTRGTYEDIIIQTI